MSTATGQAVVGAGAVVPINAPGPGNVLVTNAPADRAMQIAQGAAAHLQFRVLPTSQWSMRAQKGSLVGGILLGAFFAYCNFRVEISQAPDGATVIAVVRNIPWWTGVIGVKRVANRADELGDAIGQGLVSSGFAVMGHTRS